MGFLKKGGIIADVIRCDEPDYLVWKWHPVGSETGNNKRENAIRLGSSLRVKDGSVAVFVYKQKDGVLQDFIEGPFDEMISTKNLPVLSGIIGLAYDGKSPFQAEVYFINLAKVVQSRFAVPYFDVYDPRFQDFGVPVAVRGTMTFHIQDYHEFIKLHRLEEFNHEMFDLQIRDALVKNIKHIVANVPAKNEMSVIQIEKQIGQINDMVVNDLQNRLSNEFGIIVTSIDISEIDIDKSSDGYAQLNAVSHDITYATTIAKAEAEIKTIQETQRITIENFEENLRIQREESAYEKHKKTQSANIGAYQVEKQAEVGVAGAEALGHIGENGAGGIDLGATGGGFNPTAIMTGIALGGAVSQNIAGTLNNAIKGMNRQPQENIEPPPIPTVAYYVAINGQAVGPFDINALAQKKSTGQFNEESLIWKNGMSEWAKAGSIDELKSLFAVVPPVPPIG